MINGSNIDWQIHDQRQNAWTMFSQKSQWEISMLRLNTLPHLHLAPINLIVFQDPHGETLF